MILNIWVQKNVLKIQKKNLVNIHQQGWFEDRAVGGWSGPLRQVSDQFGHLRPSWSFTTNLLIFDKMGNFRTTL